MAKKTKKLEENYTSTDWGVNTKKYYIPPISWSYENIVNTYGKLADSLEVKIPLEFVCRENHPIFNIKNVLHEISNRLSIGDAAAIEMSKQFVIDDVYFHYSGFIRATMARRLKSVALSESDKQELRNGIYILFLNGTFGPEYKELSNLLRTIGLGSMQQH